MVFHDFQNDSSHYSHRGFLKPQSPSMMVLKMNMKFNLHHTEDREKWSHDGYVHVQIQFFLFHKKSTPDQKD